MTTELRLLGAALIIGVVQIFWAAYEARRQQGLKWAGGPRDEPRPVTGRGSSRAPPAHFSPCCRRAA